MAQETCSDLRASISFMMHMVYEPSDTLSIFPRSK